MMFTARVCQAVNLCGTREMERGDGIAAHRTLERGEKKKRRFSENPSCRDITVMVHYHSQAQNRTCREAQKLTGWHSSERQETKDVRSQTRQSA